MMRIIEYLKLLRVHQWYKNVVIFLPLFFVGKLFDVAAITQLFIGFIAFCLISSTNYIINDIIDRKKDAMHPEKKKRPLASKSITLIEAIIIGILAFMGAIILAIPFGIVFTLLVIGLFLLTLAYSLFLKEEPILDILLIAINFVIRAVAGVFIIKVLISPWLILCPFFIALFLAVGKRDADLRYLKGNATSHRKVLKYYDLQTTNSFMIITTTSLLISYALYAFSKSSLMLLTLPFAVYVIFRYYTLVMQGSLIARRPEKMYTDWRLTLGVLLWGITTFILLYVPQITHIFLF